MIRHVLNFGQDTNLSGAHPVQCVVDRFEGPDSSSFLSHMQSWFQQFTTKLGVDPIYFKSIGDVVTGPAFSPVPLCAQSLSFVL